MKSVLHDDIPPSSQASLCIVIALSRYLPYFPGDQLYVHALWWQLCTMFAVCIVIVATGAGLH